MRLFKRGPSGPDADAIPAFWSWWSTARDRVAAAIEAGDPGRMVAEISKAVDAIDPRLAWELGPGRTARHGLVVTPEGDPAVRAAALRWLQAAPPVDGTWEYHASRQASVLGRLAMGGVDVDLTAYRAIASWDEARERVDVRLWHPALADATDQLRQHVAFLFLDNLLGEDDVERWIGSIDPLEAPIEGRTPDELRAEVARRATEATGESWILGQRPDGALVVANAAAKPIDHPFAATRLTITVEEGMEQFAGTERKADIEAAEDRLVEALAPVGVVQLGHVTERRRRRSYLMCRDGAAARAIAGDWATTVPDIRPKVDVAADPGWTVRGELGI